MALVWQPQEAAYLQICNLLSEYQKPGANQALVRLLGALGGAVQVFKSSSVLYSTAVDPGMPASPGQLAGAVAAVSCTPSAQQQQQWSCRVAAWLPIIELCTWLENVISLSASISCC